MTQSAAASRTSVRRRDRAVDDDAWIRALLHRAPVGSLSVNDAEGRPFLNMNLFVYDEQRHVIWMHTARLSSTRSAVEAGEDVCFGVMEMGRLLPADRAKNFSVEYASVVVFGRGRVIVDQDEAAAGLQCLMDKYAPHLEPGRDYAAAAPHELDLTSVYRIDILEWSGKTKVAPEDFPGAFVFRPAASG